MNEKANAMSKALIFLMNRELSRGWIGWHTMWAETVAKLASLRRGLSHLVNRKLSAGWNAWVEMAEEKALFMQKLRKGLSFMVNRRTAVAMASWLEHVSGDTNGPPLLKALLHLMRRNLSRGWIGWHVWWEGYARKKASNEAQPLHLLNRDLARGFSAWVEMVEEKAEFMRLLRRGAGFIVNRQIALGFGGWLHYVSLSHSQEQKTAAMKRALVLYEPRVEQRLERLGGDVGRASRQARVLTPRHVSPGESRAFSRLWRLA